jgi:hypothetical protein
MIEPDATVADAMNNYIIAYAHNAVFCEPSFQVNSCGP